MKKTIFCVCTSLFVTALFLFVLKNNVSSIEVYNNVNFNDFNTFVNTDFNSQTYQLYYELDGGTLEIEDSSLLFSYHYSDTPQQLPTVYKDNYIFQGYKINNSERLYTVLSNNIDGNITLTAIYSPVQYEINYVLNGGQINNEYSSNYYYGDKNIELPTPYKSGYDFAGWYTDENLTEKFDYSKETSGNITLYAKYIEQEAQIVANITNDVQVTNTSLNYVSINSYYADLVWWGVQSDCDNTGVGVFFLYGNKTVIADHNYQGFSLIENLAIGSTATVNLNGSVSTVSLVSRYTGVNTGTDLLINGSDPAYNYNDGWLVMYTCTSGSDSITITFWQ